MWTCDGCGRDNFERAIPAELTPEDRKEIAEDLGVDVMALHGNYVVAPDYVKCQHCGEEFETEDAP